MRGIRQQFHWHENPTYRFAPVPDLCRDPVVQKNVARLADYGLVFDLQVFDDQMAGASELAEACPYVTFVLQHAGMLEDLSEAGGEQWREGMEAAGGCVPQRGVQAVSGFGTFIHRNRSPSSSRRLTTETVAMFGADRCLWGSNFPIEKLWTGYAAVRSVSRAAAGGLSERKNRMRFSTIPQPGLPADLTGRRRDGLEIKMLDYGDIELESSFLVLGRDCGRTRRVPVYGFLILGGQYPIVVDTGYRDNAIMESLGHARPAIPREHGRTPACQSRGETQ